MSCAWERGVKRKLQLLAAFISIMIWVNWRNIFDYSSKEEGCGASNKITLVEPSKEPYNFNIQNYKSYSQWGQDLTLLTLFGDNLENPFFLESGAAKGEFGSNTVLLEKKGWEGMLVEPSPDAFDELLSKNRKAFAFNGGISTDECSRLMHFNTERGQGSVVDSTGATLVQVEPVHSLLEAVGRKTVDLWSLDVEGPELAILKATDFTKIEVGVMLIEMNSGWFWSDKKSIQNVMTAAGFIDIGTSKYRYKWGSAFESILLLPERCRVWSDLDHYFVNPEYFKQRDLPIPTSAPWKGMNSYRSRTFGDPRSLSGVLYCCLTNSCI